MTGNNWSTLLQWVLIIGLAVTCLFTCRNRSRQLDDIKGQVQDEHTYTKVYDSQEIKRLRDENKALYDSIKHLKNVELVAQVEYKYLYKTDTCYVDTSSDKTVQELMEIPDSLYDILHQTDSISYRLKILGKKVKWYDLDFELQDNIVLVNMEKDGLNQLVAKFGLGGTTITDVTAAHRKDGRFWDRFSFGPAVVFGYDFANKNVSCTLGVGFMFRF